MLSQSTGRSYHRLQFLDTGTLEVPLTAENIVIVRCRTLTLVAAVAFLLPEPVSAPSLIDRARKMNRRELTAEEALKRREAEPPDRRNKISMRRIKPAMPGVDWNTDPTAIPYMLYQINKRTGLPVYVDNDGLDVATPELFEYTVIYLTSHYRWGFNERESENVAEWLRRGGTLFLDDCYNRGSPFADSVRPEIAKMFPEAEQKLLVRSDPVVKDVFRMTYRTSWPGEGFDDRPWQYYQVEGRPAVFFSPNDDGCGWEISTPPSASNPIGEGIGHGGDNRQRESMYQWVTNWFLFVYTH